MLAAMSTGNMVGLAVTGAIFIAFALLSSFVAPRIWPDFPGKQGLPVFIIASLVLFVAMLAAVEVFGVEEEEASAGEEHAAPAGGGEVKKTITVKEDEFHIILPSTGTLGPGQYTFKVQNVGKIPHDLAIEGGTISDEEKTPLIAPGKSATLTVDLGKGAYELYCTVPGHKEAGMDAELPVG